MTAFLQSRFAGMRTFLIVWLGQTLSRFGTSMTAFGLFGIWAWQETHSASALSFIWITTTIGALIASLIGGGIVDRFSRKTVMMWADGIAALATVAYLILYSNGYLQIWHLYAGAAFVGLFGQLHGLAYSAATTMMMTKAQYARAGSLRFLTHYGAAIFAQPLAAALYTSLGLEGIMIIDLLTVTAAIGTVAFVNIAQPTESQVGRESHQTSRFKEMIYGFRYVRQSPSLLAVVISGAIFIFFHDLTAAVHTPMILARSDENIQLYAAVGTAAGLGGLTGTLFMTLWGGPRNKMRGWLFGTMGAGIAKMAVSLGRNGFIWLPAQFSSSVNFPIRGGSLQSILMSKVEPDIQGRFFAVLDIAIMLSSILAFSIGGPLGDYILEPAMASNGSLAHSPLASIFGTGPGAGYAIIYFGGAFAMMVVGLLGFRIKSLTEIEDRLVDHDLKSLSLEQSLA